MHHDAEYLAQARRWLRYAVEDLGEAETLVGRPHFAPRHACFFVQQAVEKAIKAVLVFLHIDFPRVHDLDTLRALVPQGWPFRDERSFSLLTLAMCTPPQISSSTKGARQVLADRA